MTDVPDTEPTIEARDLTLLDIMDLIKDLSMTLVEILNLLMPARDESEEPLSCFEDAPPVAQALVLWILRMVSRRRPRGLLSPPPGGTPDETGPG